MCLSNLPAQDLDKRKQPIGFGGTRERRELRETMEPPSYLLKSAALPMNSL